MHAYDLRTKCGCFQRGNDRILFHRHVCFQRRDTKVWLSMARVSLQLYSNKYEI